MGGLRRREVLVGGGTVAGGLWAGGAEAMTRLPGQTRWVFDRLSNIGGVDTMVEGDPTLVDSPYGKAVQFDGVDDRLVIGKHPLAGMGQFTFEALFRPDGGVFAQRWFHLNEEDAAPGAPPSVTRILFRDPGQGRRLESGRLRHGAGLQANPAVPGQDLSDRPLVLGGPKL